MRKKNFQKFLSKLFLIIRAYDTLGDSSKRKNYDDYGMSGDQSDQYKNYYNQNGGFGGSKLSFNLKILSVVLMVLVVKMEVIILRTFGKILMNFLVEEIKRKIRKKEKILLSILRLIF